MRDHRVVVARGGGQHRLAGRHVALERVFYEHGLGAADPGPQGGRRLGRLRIRQEHPPVDLEAGIHH